uniref:Uncharacterized protein n=1 Tax=Nomascus leucogenys TaxID=61853 RepID=A0A2I3GAA2_NOMLE
MIKDGVHSARHLVHSQGRRRGCRPGRWFPFYQEEQTPRRGCSPPGRRGPHWGRTLPKPSSVSEEEGEHSCWARHREPRTKHFSRGYWWHLHFQWHFQPLPLYPRIPHELTPALPGAEELLIEGLSGPALQPGLLTVLQRQR